jgi:hypothetical protein
MITVIYLIRKYVTANRPLVTGPTWGCGYETSSPKIQYTASSFVRPYVKIIKPVIHIKKSSEEISDVFPEAIHSETHFYDKIEMKLVDWPTKNLRGLLGRFKFLQNGSVQFYVLYGVVFICISITIPLVIDGIRYLVEILKTL